MGIENDWAWNLAVNMMSGHDSEGVLDMRAEDLAAALRKAKADSYREIADWIFGPQQGSDADPVWYPLLRKTADKIERGEA